MVIPNLRFHDNLNDTLPRSPKMIRDEIVVGTTHDDIRKNALENQWNLKDLVENGRKLEANKKSP